MPDLSAFPRRAWLAAARKALGAAPDHLLGYPDPRGLPQLRAVLADYLARARGVDRQSRAHRDLRGLRARAGLALPGAPRPRRGTLAMEAYGHQAHRDIAAAQGLRLRPLPVDGSGAVLGEAARGRRGAADPGPPVPAGRDPAPAAAPGGRAAGAAWSSRTTTTGSSATTASRWARCRRSRPSMWSTRAPRARAWPPACGSAGWSSRRGCSTRWPAELAAGPSALDQLTLAEFITSGAYDRQVRRARLAYRRRRDRLAAALRRQGLHVTGIAAGLHALLDCPGTGTEHAVVARAAEHGLAVDGLESYRTNGPPPARRAGLVIGYGRPPEHAFTTALARLCAVLPGSPAGRAPGRYRSYPPG